MVLQTLKNFIFVYIGIKDPYASIKDKSLVP